MIKKNADELINKVEKILQKCLVKIDDVNVPEEDKKNLEEMSSKILNPNNYSIGNAMNYKPIINSLKINSGIYNISPVADSMKGITDINLGVAPAINSIKDTYEINSSVMSMADSMKGITDINLGVASAMNSVKDTYGINSSVLSIADSMRGITGINFGIPSTMDSILESSRINPAITFATESMERAINDSALLENSIEKPDNILKKDNVNKKTTQEKKKD